MSHTWKDKMTGKSEFTTDKYLCFVCCKIYDGQHILVEYYTYSYYVLWLFPSLSSFIVEGGKEEETRKLVVLYIYRVYS